MENFDAMSTIVSYLSQLEVTCLQAMNREWYSLFVSCVQESIFENRLYPYYDGPVYFKNEHYPGFFNVVEFDRDTEEVRILDIFES